MNFSDENFPLIQSRDNQKLKFARAVRDERERGKIFLEGIRLCGEALKSDVKIESVFTDENFQNRDLIATFAKKGANIFRVESKIFDSIADTKNSQGIVVICEKPESGREAVEKKLTENSLLLLLHRINNPSNLGAILRTAEAAGVSAIVTTENSANVFSPKALRGSMGAGLRFPVWTNADFFEVLHWAKKKNIKSVCADIKSRKSYTEINWNESKLLILGSEGHGLTESELSAAEESLFIPMANDVESLNIAVACGIILFEAKRRRDAEI